MTRQQEIRAELQRLGRVAIAINARYGAFMALHDAAMLTNNTDEILQRRDDLHTVLDALLDNARAIQQLSDELERTL